MDNPPDSISPPSAPAGQSRLASQHATRMAARQYKIGMVVTGGVHESGKAPVAYRARVTGPCRSKDFWGIGKQADTTVMFAHALVAALEYIADENPGAMDDEPLDPVSVSVFAPSGGFWSRLESTSRYNLGLSTRIATPNEHDVWTRLDILRAALNVDKPRKAVGRDEQELLARFKATTEREVKEVKDEIPAMNIGLYQEGEGFSDAIEN